MSRTPTRRPWPPDMERTRSRAPRDTCCPAWDSSLAGASFVCLTCVPGSELDAEPPCRSPESRPSNDRVPVPTLVVTVTSLFPTSHVLVLPPARRNSPTGDLLGTAVKLENTYRAIMSRHVSVSSKWRFFRLSSAWAIEFSSADPKLALVRDVCILLEGETIPGLEVRAEGRTMLSHLPPGAKAQCMHGQDGLAQKAHQSQGTVASGATTSQALWTASSQRGREAEPHSKAPLFGAQLRER